jgi:pilus assembly protein CpaB
MFGHRKFLLILGLSLGWALLVTLIFYRVAASANQQNRTTPMHPLVVATRVLEIGSLIPADSVKLMPVPESLFPKGGFERVEDVVGRPVISTVQPQEPVLEARLAARGAGAGLAPLIPAGMRAVAVRINDVAGVAGFVLPGMRVDVLVTGNPPGSPESVTTTILQNITVLSVGQTVQADARNQAINATVATLLVNPGQAEALTLANDEGHIQLVLRNSADRQVAPTSGRQLGDLYGPPRPDLASLAAARRARTPEPPRPPEAVATPAAPPVVPPAAPEEVVIIRGNQKTVEPLSVGTSVGTKEGR